MLKIDGVELTMAFPASTESPYKANSYLRCFGIIASANKVTPLALQFVHGVYAPEPVIGADDPYSMAVVVQIAGFIVLFPKICLKKAFA